MKKLSILGLVLVAASAVASAFIPFKAKVSGNGELRNVGFTSSGDATCIADPDTNPNDNNCNYTAATGTSAANPGTSDNGLGGVDDSSVLGTTPPNTSAGN